MRRDPIPFEAAAVLLRTMAYMTDLMIEAAAQGKLKPLEEIMKRIRAGRRSVTEFFDMASQSEIGELGESGEGKVLLETCKADDAILVIDIALGAVCVESAAEALDQEEWRMVGVAFCPIPSPEWIFWCPVDWPQEDRCYLVLPAWKPD